MSPDDLIQQIETLGGEFDALVAPLSDEQELRAAQAQFLGKKGKVSQLMKLMGKMPPESRKDVGAAFNQVKNRITAAVNRKLADLEGAARAADLARVVNVTLPGRDSPQGHVHILSQVRAEVVEIFAELGFEVAEGPQVETDFHNFEALALHKDHPARDEQDTFYVSDDIVLRTHTSPVQIRVMQAQKPPVKIIAPGVVYRRDDDPTHSPVFTQVEGLLVDTNVRFSDLKGVLLHFVRRFFGKALEIRFRPSYFPFVEPGAEVEHAVRLLRRHRFGLPHLQGHRLGRDRRQRHGRSGSVRPRRLRRRGGDRVCLRHGPGADGDAPAQRQRHQILLRG